eukprot:949359-Pelagomonas_calceolata.AAC.2
MQPFASAVAAAVATLRAARPQDRKSEVSKQGNRLRECSLVHLQLQPRWRPCMTPDLKGRLAPTSTCCAPAVGAQTRAGLIEAKSLPPSLAYNPAPRIPAPHVPAPSIPAPRVPAPHIPAPHIPAPHVPAPRIPAPHIPAPRIPALMALGPTLLGRGERQKGERQYLMNVEVGGSHRPCPDGNGGASKGGASILDKSCGRAATLRPIPCLSRRPMLIEQAHPMLITCAAH